MVKLEIADYSELFDWFTLAFGKKEKSDISPQAKSTFWKLKFLSDDEIKEIEEEEDDEE